MHSFVREAIASSLPPADRAQTQERHAEFYVRWAAPWTAEVKRAQGAEALTSMREELYNLLAAVDRSLDLRPVTPERVDRALRGALALSSLLTRSGPIETHLALLDRATAGARGLPDVDQALLANVLRARGDVQAVRERFGEARQDLERALDLARSVANRPLEAQVLGSFGALLRSAGVSTEAIDVLGESIEIAAEEAEQRTEAVALGERGVARLQQGALEAARVDLDRAIELAQACGDRGLEGVEVGRLAQVHRLTGNTRRAAELFQQALDALGDVGDQRNVGRLLGSVGVLFNQLGQLLDAFDHYDQSRTVAREVGDRRTEARALSNMGLIFAEQDNMDDAVGLLHQALALSRNVGDRLGEGCDVGHLGVLHHLQGDLERAQHHYHRALELLDRELSPDLTARFLAWSAACAAEAGEQDLAEQRFEAALESQASSDRSEGTPGYRVLRAALDLARAAALLDGGDQVGAARAREAAREHLLEDGAANFPATGDLRMANKWLRERLGDLA
jgi:tetratricopeptide (TPR) repeat protein